MSVIETLPTNMVQGMWALCKTVYKILQCCEPLCHVQRNAKLVPLNRGRIIPSYHSAPSVSEVLRFIFLLFRFSQGLLMKRSSVFLITQTRARTGLRGKTSFFMFVSWLME